MPAHFRRWNEMTQALFYLLALVAIVFMLGVVAAIFLEDGDDDD